MVGVSGTTGSRCTTASPRRRGSDTVYNSAPQCETHEAALEIEIAWGPNYLDLDSDAANRDRLFFGQFFRSPLGDEKTSPLWPSLGGGMIVSHPQVSIINSFTTNLL